jgi:EF-P beta-lysylation protein EpmB
MIPLTAAPCQATGWKKLLAEAIRDPLELLAAVGVEAEQLPVRLETDRAFPLRVPRGFVARMRRGDPHDPLLLQVLPRRHELATPPGFVADPVGDGAATARPGLLHKYQGRALLIATGACPVHCRYCFRRHFPYGEARLGADDWQGILAYLLRNPHIEELILSGGDPLSLSNGRLQALSAQLAKVPQLKRLRIHTRMPVVLPERVDAGLLAWLDELPWPTVVVIHCNHGNEVDATVAQALHALRRTGASLLNQSVLLRGINDRTDSLAHLSETLFQAGTLPYYLHLLDPVQGAAHFDVPEEQGRQLVEQLRRQLPGYLVPRLVRERQGAPYKRLADGQFI